MLDSAGRDVAPVPPERRNQTVRRILSFFRPYRWAVYTVLATIVVTSLLGLVNPFLLKQIIDVAIPSQDLALLTAFVLLMIIVPIISGLIGVGQSYLNNIVGQRVMQDLRNALYSHLQRMPLRFFTETRTGEIQSRLSNDVGGIQSIVTDTASSTFANIVTVISTVAAMIFIDWRLTALSLAILPLFMWLTYRVGKVRRRLAGQTQSSLADITAITEETVSVSGMLLTKTFGQQAAAVDRYRAGQRQARRAPDPSGDGRALVLHDRGHGLLDHAGAGLLAGRLPVHYRRARRAHHRRHRRLHHAPVAPLLPARPAAQRAGRGAGRAGPLRPHLRVPRPARRDRRQARRRGPRRRTTCADTSASATSPSAIAAWCARLPTQPIRTARSLRHPTRRRSPRRPWPRRPRAINANGGAATVERLPFGLSDVDFEAKPGQLVALVGPSGSGKTTTTYLLPRLYDVDEGAVEIDGNDVRDVTLASLGEIIGFVTQETFLFHASVRENLRYAKPDATDDELEEAARIAAIHERVADLPDGYDTIVGERGYKLCGGEKQRIALARVLLKDPRILVLDEATSALDSVSERLIQAAIERVQQGRTTIAIAHRLSTILRADLIVVMEHGHVVERGRHDELLAHGGLYARLYREQFLAGAPDAEVAPV